MNYKKEIHILHVLPCLFMVLFFCFYSCSPTQNSTGVSVTDLRCEYLTNPLGIDVQDPRFSWKLVDPDFTRGQKQTAWQIVVSSPADDGGSSNIEWWDSGKINSPASVNNEYEGPVLKSDRKYYWKVRVWDQDGNPSDWSPESFFSMGPQKPSDWEGDWIRYKEADNIKHIWYRKNFSLESVPKRYQMCLMLSASLYLIHSPSQSDGF